MNPSTCCSGTFSTAAFSSLARIQLFFQCHTFLHFIQFNDNGRVQEGFCIPFYLSSQVWVCAGSFLLEVPSLKNEWHFLGEGVSEKTHVDVGRRMLCIYYKNHIATELPFSLYWNGTCSGKAEVTLRFIFKLLLLWFEHSEIYGDRPRRANIIPWMFIPNRALPKLLHQ